MNEEKDIEYTLPIDFFKFDEFVKDLIISMHIQSLSSIVYQQEIEVAPKIVTIVYTSE